MNTKTIQSKEYYNQLIDNRVLLGEMSKRLQKAKAKLAEIRHAMSLAEVGSNEYKSLDLYRHYWSMQYENFLRIVIELKSITED